MNGKKIRRQYGLWDSPISPASLARGLTFSDVAWDQDGTLVWRETRSDRGLLVVQEPDGQAVRDLNDEYSVRAGVGYGGGDFTVSSGYVYFAEASSGRLYRQSLSHGIPQPVTPAFGRYASPLLSPDGRWLLFIHTYENQDSLGIVSADGSGWPQPIAMGEDFYMQPAWHPRGDRLAWICWNQPNMPWDGTYLRLGKLHFHPKSPPILEEVQEVAGGENTSIFQPLFSPDGRQLAYVSDESGWWQLFLYDLEKDQVRQLTFAEAEHGMPAWIQGLRTFGFSPDGRLVFVLQNREGFSNLLQIDVASGEQVGVDLELDYTALDQIGVSPRQPAEDTTRIALIASGARTPTRVITLDILAEDASGADEEPRTLPAANLQVRRRSSAENIAPEIYAPVEPLTWSGEDGQVVYGLYYPAQHPDFEGIGLPPLIVSIHGGPTSQVRAVFNPKAQFFTTRGYSVLEVNYRGSTGYGREYRDALKGNWGVHDVADAISGASHLVDQGRVDGARLVIMGGSAGGFTVLQALAKYPGFFKAGICLYGVANQFTLVADTHKFEARYSDSLLGPLPEAADVYRDRSPVFHAGNICDPIIVCQGEEDQVVPRDQSDAIVATLRQRGVPHEYHLYPGEGHGFRKAETIVSFYQSVDDFLKQHVIFA
jgi:dipeptidyl aminopeptidase/acylaminoacyl peptidase